MIYGPMLGRIRIGIVFDVFVYIFHGARNRAISCRPAFLTSDSCEMAFIYWKVRLIYITIYFLFLDYEHVESAKFKEYERLEGDGYDETIKDEDHHKLKKLHTPGLGHDPRTPRTMKAYSTETEMAKYTTSDYVIPPKVPQLQMGPGIGKTISFLRYL